MTGPGGQLTVSEFGNIANSLGPNTGLQSKLSLIGQRCGISGQLLAPGGSTPYMTNHHRVLMPYGADAIQLVYAGFYEASNDFVSTANGGGASGSNKVGDPYYLPSMFNANGVSYINGTGYIVGDIDTFAVTSSTGIAPVRVMVTAVSAGVPTQVQIIDGGLYNTPLAANVSPSSTTGSGTGAQVTFSWNAGGAGLHVGIETTWNSLIAAGAGTGGVEAVSFGPNTAYNTALNWNLLVPCGDLLISNIIPVDIPIGGAIGLRTSWGYGTPPTGRVPINATSAPGAPSANYEAATAAATFTDFSISGAIGTTRTGSLGILQPALILGIPKKQGPSIIGIGDSRLYGRDSGTDAIGSFQPLDADGNCGWFENALSRLTGSAYFPWANFSVGGGFMWSMFLSGYNGLTLPNLNGRYGRLKAIGLAKPTAVYVGLNVNDLGALGGSYATLQAWEKSLISELKGLGVKYVFTDTTAPYTTSTDNFATVVNQTQNSSATPGIIARNTGLAAGTWAPYDFFIDQRSNVESSLNSGFWRVDGNAETYTGDGLHGSGLTLNNMAATAAAAIAAAITL